MEPFWLGVKWPGYDFNTAAELCNCCGQEVLKSGSRYSVWFCRNYCFEQVGLLNGRLERYAIPIGRHSVHGGFLLKPKKDKAALSLQIELWADRWKHIMGAMDVLHAWSRKVVRDVLQERWPEGTTNPPLEAYLERCRPDEAEKMRRFREMVGFFEQRGVGPEGGG